MAGLWFEELSQGLKIEHSVTRTVSEADNTLFSVMTMNPQPLHLDAEFSSRTEFGQRLVNSLFTLGLVVGISVSETTLGTTVANLGFGKIEFPAPVFHGDTIRVETVVKARRESKSRSSAGVVTFEHTGYNQHGTAVARCERSALMLRCPAESAEVSAGAGAGR
ncbi:MaoC family dehydratase [Amycolatopsis pithecellobii]|uniref:MaoC family dehydratase n=1 Tax=Amycolatopsis pithecellobii TaxID=664692 RepID=A0A6N7YU39_9PSEU|nr:MaoC family dehydratase [Amycolatopsis pithecellobii]MTD55452.1 MaoC family dehydratase [Amycolatopsis pithecellobii]